MAQTKQNMQLASIHLGEYEQVTYGALATAEMGNASPAQVVAANAQRRALIICNTSDTTGYFCFDDSTGLTQTVYVKSLAAGATWEIKGPYISVGAVYAICGSASKNITYQEAT
jgi:hypothetical protein